MKAVRNLMLFAMAVCADAMDNANRVLHRPRTGMAIIKYGGGIVDARGSVAGNTFSRNRFGAYLRSRVVPVNPNSSRQQVVRAAVQAITQRWKDTLTDAQRAGWATYAAAIPWLNKLGETQYLTGFNMYVRTNTFLTQIGGSLVDAAPATLSLANGDPAFAITASEATQLVSVAFDDGLDWVDEDDAYMAVYCGQPINKTRNFYGGPWRYMGKIAGDSVTAPTTPTTMTAPFQIAEDQKIFCRARIVRADGRLSQYFRSDIDVAG